MAATRANNGAKTAEERMQARAPEMELIREAQAGSRAAFDTLVRQYEQQVLRLALHLTGSEHDAEDIFQEAFLKAYRYIGNFRFECSFYTWIYRIVTNLCLDQMRRRKTTTPGTSLTCWLRSRTTGRFRIRPRSWNVRRWASGFNRRWRS
jgi:RNA polymerase sigma-70 factor (ECF subfamily)